MKTAIACEKISKTTTITTLRTSDNKIISIAILVRTSTSDNKNNSNFSKNINN